MRQSDDPRLQECLEAFAARDYPACYRAALREPNKIARPERLLYAQLAAICLQRLGQMEDRDELPRRILGDAESPWHRSLLQLTFGQATLDAVLHTAQNEEQRCQATYYAGARLLTTGQHTAAEELLRACVAHDSDDAHDALCVERRLAEIELAATSGPGTPEVAEQAFTLFVRRAGSYVRQGRFEEAVRAAEEACDLARRTWGNDVHLARGLTTLMAALGSADRVEEAARFAPLALRLGQEHFGTDDPELASLFNTVAYVYKSTGDLDGASRHYRSAADIWGRSTEHRLESAAALNNIARIETERGEPQRAETLFRRALDDIEGLDDDIGLRAGLLNNLGALYSGKGDLDAAERLHRQALEHLREQVGEDHPDYASTLSNLGHVYKDQGRLAEAEPLLRRAWDILEPALGELHPRALTPLGALLEIYQATGQHEAAERLTARVLSEADSTPDAEWHDLHPLPDVTPWFLGLRATMPDSASVPEVVGGALDWRSPSYQRSFARLAENFAEGRYGACLPEAVELNAHDATHEVLQMWLMCSIRTRLPGPGSAPEPDPPPWETVRSLVTDPWYAALVDLTLGLTNPADVEQLADTEEKACQLLHYAAQRRMAEGDVEESLAGMAAAASGPPCFEAWMAARTLSASSRASDRDLAARVHHLNMAAVDGYRRNDLAAAVPAAEEAWRLAAGLEEGTRERTLSHYNAARAAYHTGDLALAESLLLQFLTVTRQGENYDRLAVGQALKILGVLYTDLGRFDRAEPTLLEALDELRLVGREAAAERAQAQANLAELYREMRDLPKAIRLCREALEGQQATIGRQDPEYARTLDILGVLYTESAEFRTAEELLLKARRIRQAALPQGHADLGVSARSLAHLYALQGRYEEAEAQVRKALEISENVSGTDNLAHATELNSLACVCMMTGRLDEARRHCEESQGILTRVVGAVHGNTATVGLNLVALRALDGDLRGALELAEQQEEAASRLLFDILATTSERQRLQLIGDEHLRLSALLTLVAALDAPDDDVAHAFDLVLRHKGVVGETQSAFRDETYAQASPELKAKAGHVRSLRDKIARKTLSGPGPEGLTAHRATLLDWTEEKERIEAELARTLPGVRLAQRMREVSGSLVRSLLPEGSALVEIVRFGLVRFALPSAVAQRSAARHRYWAFVVRPEPHSGVRLVDLGDADGIDRLLASYRGTVVVGDSDRDAAPPPTSAAGAAEFEAGEALRAAVFDPLRPALGDARRLYLAPDGDLARLPWEVLPLSRERRILDDFHISYLGVGRDLLRISAPAAGKSTAPLVVADPDFDLAATGATGATGATAPGLADGTNGTIGRGTQALQRYKMRFARLPGTQREGRAVAALLGVRPVTGAAATETAVKSCRGPLVLHLATHGFLLPDPEPSPQTTLPMMEVTAGAKQSLGRLSNAEQNPFLRSGLVLAGANTWLDGGVLPAEAEDGILPAEDVTGLDLTGTELVVLSACQTGLGSPHLSEGLLGLRRAFVQAGARTLVTSLWQVPDAETETLMTGFYRRVMTGEDKAAALRNAQLALKERQPNPYYWGAFVCQGDPGGLTGLPPETPPSVTTEQFP